VGERDELLRHFLENPQAEARRAAPGPSTPESRHKAQRSLRDLIPNVFEYPIPTHPWLVDGIIAEGSLNLLAGSPGQYKTWLALELSRAVAHGENFLGRATRKRPVLYADLENSVAEIKRRLEILGFESTLDFMYWGMHCDLSPASIGSGVYPEFVEREAVKPLIVFDSLVRFSTAENENDAAQMAQVMSGFRLLNAKGATVLLLHHSGKSAGSAVRDSSDITAGPDVVLTVASCDDGAINLKTAKTRFSEPFELKLRFDPDSGGPVFKVCDDSAGEKRRKEVETVTEFIRANPGQSLRQIISALSGRVPNHRVRDIMAEDRFRYEDGPRNAKLFYTNEEPSGEALGESHQLNHSAPV
jgi:hypothetical protein